MEKRNLLRNMGAIVFGTSMASGVSGASPEVGTECGCVDGGGGGNSSYDTWETAEDSYYGAVDIESGIYQYPAEGRTGVSGEDYWMIRFDSQSNSQARSNASNDEQVQELQSHESVLSSQDNIVVDDSKYWVGGGARLNSYAEDYQRAKDVAETIATSMPFVGQTLTALEMVDNLYDIAFADSGNEIWDRTFDYATDSSSKVYQADCWQRLQAEEAPGGSGSFTLEDRSWGFDTSLAPITRFNISYTAPSSSPQEAVEMSTTEQNKRGIQVFDSKTVRQNPEEFGKSPEEASSIMADKVVYAPVRVSVDMTTDTITPENS